MVGVTKLTPVIPVEAIEPVLGFWEKLGFEKQVEVPHGDRLGFVILTHGEVEVMYQSLASLAADLPNEAVPLGRAFLFVETAELDAVKLRMVGETVVVPERTTFYGMREIAWSDRAGNVVCLAQRI